MKVPSSAQYPTGHPRNPTNPREATLPTDTAGTTISVTRVEARDLIFRSKLLLQAEKKRDFTTPSLQTSWAASKSSVTFFPRNSSHCVDSEFRDDVDGLSKVFAASSLWCTYSMLKTILRVREKVDVSSFTNVVSFLKKMSVRHVPRKSNVLSRSQIDEFLLNAPDDVFLLIKVVIAFGVFGAYRRQELHDLCFNDVKVEGSVLVFFCQFAKKSTGTKAKDGIYDRNFVISNSISIKELISNSEISRVAPCEHIINKYGVAHEKPAPVQTMDLSPARLISAQIERKDFRTLEDTSVKHNVQLFGLRLPTVNYKMKQLDHKILIIMNRLIIM
ncbi:hypothetical protein C0J52_16420 [Blattella germanica]|nr:hypothetical protein C0J52_16420 [Blattella germanica]